MVLWREVGTKAKQVFLIISQCHELSLCSNFFSKECHSNQSPIYPVNLILTQLNMQRPCFHVESHSWLRLQQIFWRNTVQSIIAIN